MKIDPRGLRFLVPLPSPARRRLWFLRTGGALHLLETAVVLEGYLKRLSFPIIDRFFQRVLSEWTTVTIPYSRILEHRYASLVLPRVLLNVLFWVPALLALLVLPWSEELFLTLYIFTLLSILALILSLYVDLRVLISRHYLTYRQADGTRAVVSFHIRSRKQRKAFMERLRANRRAASALAPPAAVLADPGPLLPMALLIALVVGRGVVAPLWGAYGPESEQTPVFRSPTPGVGGRPPLPLPGVDPVPGGAGGRPGGPRRPAPPRPLPPRPGNPPLFQPGIPEPPLELDARPRDADALVPPGLAADLARLAMGILRFLHTEGPILLLAFLLWRWNNLVRWSAVVLLAVHGCAAILNPEVTSELFQASFNRMLSLLLDLDELFLFRIGTVVAMSFYLILALILAVERGPLTKEEKADRGSPGGGR